MILDSNGIGASAINNAPITTYGKANTKGEILCVLYKSSSHAISQYRSVWIIAQIAPGTHPIQVKTRHITNCIAAAPFASDSEAKGFVRRIPLYATYAAITGGMRQANKSMKILRIYSLL